jgi:hypothetical protein
LPISADVQSQIDLEKQIVKSFGAFPGNIIYVVPSGVTRAVFQERSELHDMKWTFEALERTAEALDADLLSTSNASLLLPRKLADSGHYSNRRKDFYSSISSSISNLRVLAGGGALSQLDDPLRKHLISAMPGLSADHYASGGAIQVRAQFSLTLLNDQGQEVASFPMLANEESAPEPPRRERSMPVPAAPPLPHRYFETPMVMNLSEFNGLMARDAGLTPMRVDDRILGIRIMAKGRFTAADAEAVIRNLSAVSPPIELTPKSQSRATKLSMMKALRAALLENGPTVIRETVKRIESQQLWTTADLDIFLPTLRSYLVPENFGSQRFKVRLDPAIDCTHPGMNYRLVFKPD